MRQYLNSRAGGCVSIEINALAIMIASATGYLHFEQLAKRLAHTLVH